MTHRTLPVPPHFSGESIGDVWKVPYQTRAAEAEAWAKEHDITPAHEDAFRICVLAVDTQNTFCLPEFELYVAGRSGTGAVDDNRRLCEFLYRNLGAITHLVATMDTHQALAIFHVLHLVDEEGEHPDPYTVVSAEDIERGRWRFNPAVASRLGIAPEYGQRHLLRYTRRLRETGKYELTIWPFHAMLGGIGHALVSALEEAIFFHSVARATQPRFEVKGNNPFTEHYSVLGPEVTEGPDGEPIADTNEALIDALLAFDAVIIAGQAKSHCVAWTIDDLLRAIDERERALARKVYLLEDCTSPVVVPGGADFTDDADAAFQRFSDAGMHVVRSTDPVDRWPGIAP